MLFRRRARLTDAQSAALARVLQAPTFELVPLKNALDQAAFLPAGATVSVTASPAKGIESTVALCVLEDGCSGCSRTTSGAASRDANARTVPVMAPSIIFR